MKRDTELSRRGAVIFDLDGTLTVPTLDFDEIRAQIGIPSGSAFPPLQLIHCER